MSEINELIKNNIPFAVMQYFEYLKSNKGQTNKVYELIYVNSKKKLAYKTLNYDDIDLFKYNVNKFKLVVDDKNGRIYDYNYFKKHQENTVIVEPPSLSYSKKEIEEYLKGLEDKDKKKWSSYVFIDIKLKDRVVRFKECMDYFKKLKNGK